MPKPLKIGSVAALIAILCLTAPSCFVAAVPAGRTPQFTFRSQCLVGDELRVLLETATRYRTFTSSSPKVASVKGWLITVNLSKKGPIEKRARVIGPLWDVPSERSEISFEAGPSFTKQDAAAARATPFIDFDYDGTLIRILSDPKRGVEMTRERLILGAKPIWKPDGPFMPLPPSGPPMNEETVETLSGRYRLELVDGKVTLHERLTGRRVVDPWLEAAFKECRDIKEFKNVRTWLTNDLKYLVCSPNPAFVYTRGDPRTFEYAGATYRRGNFALIWQRPKRLALVVPKPRTEDAQSLVHIDHALSLNGVLYLLYEDGMLDWITGQPDEKPAATLIPPLGGTTYRASPSDDRRTEWGLQCRPPLQILEQPLRLVFFRRNNCYVHNATHRDCNSAVIVFAWTIGNATIITDETRTGDLFHVHNSEYVPNQCTPVE